MRALGRLTLFVVVSSGTVTCLATAQPSHGERAARRMPSEIVDPWGPEPVLEKPRNLETLVDPWPSHTPPPAVSPYELVIIDPWKVEIEELVDPWREAPRSMLPRADYPIVDPWGRR
jgi:hypothetical protein